MHLTVSRFFMACIAFFIVSVSLGVFSDSLLAAKATGSLTVKITPKEAKQDGARWRVDGGAWQKGGKTVNGLVAGDHEVSFKATTGWKAPKNKTVNIQDGQETSTKGKYKTNSSDGTITLPGNVPLELVWVPSGSFMMGQYTNEQSANPDENPQHQVTFANGFWIGKYEVTQAQWVAVMGNNPSNFTGDLSRPVERVSWDAVQTFITAVNALGQGTVHLPTEAQWEYACRAGTTTRFYWGDDLVSPQIGTYAWHLGNSSSTTHPVGQKSPNAWGLYDTSGNVWEWCEDSYHLDYTGAPADGSAWVQPTPGSNRVLRGGSWGSFDFAGRSASRSYAGPTDTIYSVGFRLAS
jgi:formylglycine-generating enzyme required for sulfatase activity